MSLLATTRRQRTTSSEFPGLGWPSPRYSPQIKPVPRSSENLPALVRKSYECLSALNSRPQTPLLRPVERNSSWDDLEQSLLQLDEMLEMRTRRDELFARSTSPSRRSSSAWISNLASLDESVIHAESCQVNEPLEFTSRDIVALEKLQKKLKKEAREPGREGFRAAREQRIISNLQVLISRSRKSSLSPEGV